MGGGGSKHEDVKAVDSAGTVNNNLVFSQPVPIHHKTLEYCIIIICIIKLIEMLIAFYRIHQKMLKKNIPEIHLKSNIFLRINPATSSSS